MDIRSPGTCEAQFFVAGIVSVKTLFRVALTSTCITLLSTLAYAANPTSTTSTGKSLSIEILSPCNGDTASVNSNLEVVGRVALDSNVARTTTTPSTAVLATTISTVPKATMSCVVTLALVPSKVAVATLPQLEEYLLAISAMDNLVMIPSMSLVSHKQL